MFNNKYGNFLTVVLVITILIVVGFLVFLGIQIYKNYKISKDSIQAISEFDQSFNNNTNTITNNDTNTIQLSNEIVENTNTTTPTAKKTYKDFTMIGYIEIKKTGIKYPILEEATSKALEVAVAVTYPNTNIQLNKPGNIVIAGHNYRNEMFFSKNKNLVAGDKIYITDGTGQTLSYTIYNTFLATPEDASFYNRDTNGAIEITLTTCSDDSKSRVIVEARVE